MFDFSDVIPVFAYAGLLIVFLIGFAIASYLAYGEGKRKRRRSKYGRPAETVGSSRLADAASAFAVTLFPVWAVHGLPVLRSFSQSAETPGFAVSPWSVLSYWALAFVIGLTYVRLLRREVPISSAGAFGACLVSISWFAWGFQPLNDWFLQFSGG